MRVRRVSTASRVWTRSMGVLLTVVLGGCVFPTPPPGNPIPDFMMTSDKADPVSGAVTIEATPVNFTPNNVEFRLDSSTGPPLAVDDTAPYNVTVDTATLSRGVHTVWAQGRDGTYTVSHSRTFTTRLNVVVVLVDDMDARLMPIWAALPKTKAAIGDRGITFTNAFAPDPLCCPARSSLLTGRYPHNTGVFEFADYHEFTGAAENDTIATRLHAAGYRTGFAGKYLNGYDTDPAAVPPGWDEWFGLAGDLLHGYNFSANHDGTMESFGSAPTDYLTDVLSREATSFVDATESNDDQPFLLYVAPTAPHAFTAAPPRYAVNQFTSATPSSPPNLNEPDLSGKPEWLRDGVAPLDAAALANRTAEWRRMMGSMLGVDDMVGSIVSTLKRDGEYDSTDLVFLSDNGYNFGAHRLLQKMAPYEESIRVPFAIAGPGIPHESDDALVTHEDLAPTVLDLAGLPVPDTMDGRSLRPLFEGQTSGWRSDFLAEFSGKYNPYYVFETLANVRHYIAIGLQPLWVPTWRAVRSQQYMYIQWYGGDAHDYELYDVNADPYELTNLIATPEGQATNAALVAQMQARLDALVTCSGLSCR